MQSDFLIYGVTGYTGKLVIRECVKLGLRPVIAGRNEAKLKLLASEFQLDYRCFTLDTAAEIDKHISGFRLVLHCAGPYQLTLKPMVEACLRCNVHYADITGDVDLLQWVKSKQEEAVSKGILLLCGAGFDLVPTDCVANQLHSKMPDATVLEIAFSLEGAGVSHGTFSSMVLNLGNPGWVRIGGALTREPLGHRGRHFSFGSHKRFCISVPWGDLVTAYESTGIPTIYTFSAANGFAYVMLKNQYLFNAILRSRIFKSVLKWYGDKFITGPSETLNSNGKSLIYGKVQNQAGDICEAILQCPESYEFTARSCAVIAKKILNETIKPGFQTPAGMFGANLVMEIEGCNYL